MDRTTLAFDLVLPNEPMMLDLTQLYVHLQALPDRRARRGVRYPLPMLLRIALLAKLSGQHQVRSIAEWRRCAPRNSLTSFSFPAHDAPSGHVEPGVGHRRECGRATTLNPAGAPA